MNRLGLDEKDFARLIQTPQILKNANVHIIMSHLSCSDESENKMNNRQLLEFTSSIKLFPLYLEPFIAKNKFPFFMVLVSEDKPLALISLRFFGQFLIRFFSNIFDCNFIRIYG